MSAENIDTLILSENQLPPFDLVLRCYINHYLKKLNQHMLPRSRWRYLIMIIEFFHMLIGTGAFTLALLLPPNLLPYNILLVSIVLIGWEMLGYCFVTKICSYIIGNNCNNVECNDCNRCNNCSNSSNKITGELTDENNNVFLIPFSNTFLKLYGMLVVGLSLFFHLKPAWAPFNLFVSFLGYVLSLVWNLLGYFTNTDGVRDFVTDIIE